MKNRAIRMIWAQMAGERLRYGAALAALVPASALLYLAPMVPQVVLDEILPAEPAPGNALSRALLEVLGGRDLVREQLWIAALAIAGLTAAAGVFTYARGRWAAIASERIVRRLRDRLYDHLQRLPMDWHHGANTGDLIQRCSSDVETLRLFLATQIVEIGRALAMFVVPLPIMIAIDVRMTVASVVLMPIIVGFSYVFFRRVRGAFLEVDEAEGAMTGSLQENLVGIRVVRAFARQEHEEEKFATKNQAHERLDNRLYRILAAFWSVSDFLCFLQFAIVIATGGWALTHGTLAVGTFYWFLAAVGLFIWPMRFMGRILTQLGKATVAIGRIAEVLDAPAESQPDPQRIAEEDTAEAARLSADGAERARGEITLEDVCWTPGGASPVLDRVSLRVAAGETVALLGPSGAGKSTIARLLLRLVDPDAGRVLLDGRDLATLSRQSVRKRIAVVLQDPFLYSKTVGENIRLGRMGATPADVESAARMACIHDGIATFDDGYETLVGERGVTLSGGQRQRVALARALVDRPDILILDDALSAVDTDTEGLILGALRQRQGRHTTLLIAHRLSTLVHADRILVLEGGRIAQQGPHEQLIAEPGLYARLWRLQSSLEQEIEDEATGDANERAASCARDRKTQAERRRA